MYKMRSDDFSPYTLIRCHRCSGFYLPSSAQSLKNQNKLSMEISYQLFWNKQYKLVNNYVWETHIAVESEAYQQGPKCPYCLARCQDYQFAWWQSYPHENHTFCKVLPNFDNQNGLRFENYADLLQNRYHDGSLGVFFFVSKFSWSSKPILSKTKCLAWHGIS